MSLPPPEITFRCLLELGFLSPLLRLLMLFLGGGRPSAVDTGRTIRGRTLGMTGGDICSNRSLWYACYKTNCMRLYKDVKVSLSETGLMTYQGGWIPLDLEESRRRHVAETKINIRVAGKMRTLNARNMYLYHKVASLTVQKHADGPVDFRSYLVSHSGKAQLISGSESINFIEP